jgi:hypothetical protein
VNRNHLLWCVTAAILVTVFVAPQSRWALRNHVDILSGEFKTGLRPQIPDDTLHLPDRAFLDAIRVMNINRSTVDPPEPSLRSWSLIVRMSAVTPRLRDSNREAVLEKCLTRGAEKDPENAFWHINQAALHHAQGSRAAMMLAIQRAAQSKTYDDYSRTEYDLRVAAIEHAHGYRGNQVRMAEAWSIMFPYISSVGAMVRDTEDKDLELRRALLRAADQIQTHSRNPAVMGVPRWLVVLFINEALDIRTQNPSDIQTQIKLLANESLPAVRIERIYQASTQMTSSMSQERVLDLNVATVQMVTSSACLAALLLMAAWAYLVRFEGKAASSPTLFPLLLAGLGAIPVATLASPFVFIPLGYLLLAVVLQVRWRHLQLGLVALAALAAVVMRFTGQTYLAANLLFISFMLVALAILVWKAGTPERLTRGIEMFGLIWTVVAILTAATGSEVAILPALLYALARHHQGKIQLADYSDWARMLFLGGIATLSAYLVNQWPMASLNQLTTVRILGLGVALWISWQFLRPTLQRPLAVLGLILAGLYAGSVGLEVRQDAALARELALILERQP